MKKTNDEVLAGKMPFRARELCWPIGVPGFAVFSAVEPTYFFQKKDEIVMINQGGPEIRRVKLNAQHSANPKPSWYGDAIGRYENGDTLVIDTIGVTTRTFVDNYRTPHSDKLHVVERYKLADGGKAIEISHRGRRSGRLHHEVDRAATLGASRRSRSTRFTATRTTRTSSTSIRCQARERRNPTSDASAHAPYRSPACRRALQDHRRGPDARSPADDRGPGGVYHAVAGGPAVPVGSGSRPTCAENNSPDFCAPDAVIALAPFALYPRDRAGLDRTYHGANFMTGI